MIVCACTYSMGDEDCVLKPAMLIISGGETLFSLGGREEEYQAWGRQALLVGDELDRAILNDTTQPNGTHLTLTNGGVGSYSTSNTHSTNIFQKCFGKRYYLMLYFNYVRCQI